MLSTAVSTSGPRMFPFPGVDADWFSSAREHCLISVFSIPVILYIVEEVRERESREEDDPPPLPPPEIPLSRLLCGEIEVGECWKDSTVLVQR
jgi:hypothetical protein